ncbi:Uncharacterised protein [Klebsiella quasipneumoniae]|nr:Uncharacterised protein [Klebsiella quasipneumoniae]
MPMILALIILLTMLLLTLMWSTIRKQENVIRELSTRESWLERERLSVSGSITRSCTAG